MPTFVFGLILLAFTTAAAGAGLVTNVIGYPLVTMINDALTQMVPKVKDQRNDFVMQLICDLARGDRSQQDILAQLNQNGINGADIPQNGSSLSLLVNGNRPLQQQACLAYIATSLLYPPDNGFLYDRKEGRSASAVNAAKASREFAVRLAIAEATAQLYAVVASNITAEQGLSFSSYRRQIDAITLQYAPVFLQSIKIAFNKHPDVDVKIVRLEARSYAVTDDAGRELTWRDGVFSYKKQGIDWLSGGAILGRQYQVEVAAFALEPAKAAEKPKKGKPKARSAK